MVQVHTRYPRHAGELEFAKQPAALPDDRLHAWFNLDHLPGVQETDCLLWHRDEGVFVIEGKAVTIGMIEEFGLTMCKIKDRAPSRGPQHQAYACVDGLREFLGPHYTGAKRLPFLVGTVCWPRIARAEWNRTWSSPTIRGDFAERMLFEDDLSLDTDRFRDRLRFIYRNPPIRRGSDRPFVEAPGALERLKELTLGSERRTPAPRDLEQLRLLEIAAARQATIEVPPDAKSQHLYRGLPGTGKTFRLMQIATAHALAGKSVLFLCFNKVLATDLRRLLLLSSALRESEGNVDLVDVFRLLVRYAEGRTLGISDDEWAKDYDDYARMVIDDMRGQPSLVLRYDTILIDEAQDMQPWLMDILTVSSHSTTTVVVAEGPGQALYGSRPNWLATFEAGARVHHLRRNFRNTKQLYRVAHSFYDSRLSVDLVAAAVDKFRRKGQLPEQLLLDFERQEGVTPLVKRLDESGLTEIDRDDPIFTDQQNHVMAEEYARVIREQLLRLRQEERPVDLLVLVPTERSSERQWALLGLARAVGHEFIDYTNPKRRRDVAPAGMVRLCTFFSARGLEASRVVLFGFERLAQVASAVGVAPENLGYIVLSRAKFDCVIARRGNVPSPSIDVLGEILHHVGELR